ncbi:nucleoside monophosphate kinase [Candidatus Peregrinibacteria bacterium]|nr:nucleoside monophosphate kinase [Candidatus Peregrinibacteria bacterium]
MDLILFGIQGSGKGTQGKILKERYNMAYFETGGELRRLSKENSPLGKKIKSIIEAGHLVPNEIVMEIVENFIKKIKKGENIIFDGIPRKKIQAVSLEKLLKKDKREYKALILDLSEKEATNRLITRRICADCKTAYPAMYKEKKCEKCGGKLETRTDDNPESIKTRIKAYFNETMPVIELFEKEGKLIRVDGSKTIEEVSKLLFKALDPLLK